MQKLFLRLELLAANVFWGSAKVSWRFAAQNKSGSRLKSINQILSYLSYVTAKATSNAQKLSRKNHQATCSPQKPSEREWSNFWNWSLEKLVRNSDRVSSDATTEELRLPQTKKESQYNTDLCHIQHTDTDTCVSPEERELRKISTSRASTNICS